MTPPPPTSTLFPYTTLFRSTTDYVSAFGEILSSKIVAAAFSALGMDSALVDSRDWLVTDSAHMRASPLFEERSEEHTSELQSLRHLVCRLLLEKKKEKVNAP